VEDYLTGPQVTAVEWAERLGSLLPPEHLDVFLAITGEEERRITLTGHGRRWAEMLKHFTG